MPGQSPPGYVIETGPDELDVTRFGALCREGREAAGRGEWARAGTKLRAALSLWRGRPLLDISCPLLTVSEVPPLEELRASALEDRIDADLHLGRHHEVIAELRQLAASERLRGRHARVADARAVPPGRPTRWPPTRRPAGNWSMSWAWSPVLAFGCCISRSSAPALTWTCRRRPDRVRGRDRQEDRDVDGFARAGLIADHPAPTVQVDEPVKQFEATPEFGAGDPGNAGPGARRRRRGPRPAPAHRSGKAACRSARRRAAARS